MTLPASTPQANRPTAVYRFFDAADQLLYVGITFDLVTRWSWHQKHAEWWALQRRVAVQWYETRAEAERVEGVAVRDEDAIHNVVRPGFGPTPRQTIRMDEVLWEKLDAAAKAVGTDRSTYLRDFARWAVHEKGAKMPRRAPAGTANAQDDGGQSPT